MWRHLSSACLAMCLLLPLTSAAPALAHDPAPRVELFGGIAWEGLSASTYVGGSYAFGKSLYDPGLRLRAKAAYGFYSYDSELPSIGNISFFGQYGYAEGLVGWQFRRGPAILKLYGGIVDQAHRIAPRDPGNRVQGNETGAAVAIEAWVDLGPSVWAQLDAQATTAFKTYSVLGRIGRRVGTRFAVGLEGGALGNVEYDAVKAGGFVRLWLRRTELTISGGATGAYPLGDPAGYAALSFYRAF